MTDKVQKDFQYEGAHLANEKYGDTAEDRKLLSSDAGVKILNDNEEIAQLKSENARDFVTGAFNRSYLESRVNEEIAKGKEFTLMLIDLDNFKKINDTHGHPAGDDCLRGAKRSFESNMRNNESGVIARYGGDEFAILIPGLGDKEKARLRAEAIRKTVAETEYRIPQGKTTQTVSIGVAVWNKIDDLETIVDRIDAALYVAKKKGRNVVVQALSS